MIDGFGFAVIAAIALVAVIFEMVRRRYIQGKFAAIWIFVALLTTTLALAPNILGWAAQVTGVRVPLNLLFAVGFLGLLMILVHLTASQGRLERQVRRLAEELAIMNRAVDNSKVAEDINNKTA